MKRTFTCFLLAIILAGIGGAQTIVEQMAAQLPPAPEVPTKLDEFSDFKECAFRAHIDNFLVTLHTAPKLTGYVILYLSKNDLPSARTSNWQQKTIEDHLIFRKFDSNRIRFINGGFRDRRAIEFWVIPEGYPPPEPSDTIEAPKILGSETYLYDRKYLDSEETYWFRELFVLQRILRHERAQQKKMAREAGLSDENQNYQVEESYDWLSESFMDDAQKVGRGVLVYYADDKYYNKQKILGFIQRSLVHANEDKKLDLSKFTIIFGGYRDSFIVESWVMPDGGKPPLIKPEKRPAKEPDTIDS